MGARSKTLLKHNTQTRFVIMIYLFTHIYIYIYAWRQLCFTSYTSADVNTRARALVAHETLWARHLRHSLQCRGSEHHEEDACEDPNSVSAEETIRHRSVAVRTKTDQIHANHSNRRQNSRAVNAAARSIHYNGNTNNNT